MISRRSLLAALPFCGWLKPAPVDGLADKVESWMGEARRFDEVWAFLDQFQHRVGLIEPPIYGNNPHAT